MPYANIRVTEEIMQGNRANTQTLTRGKSSSEEHVEEILWGDIRLEVSLGVPSSASTASHLAVLVIVTPLLRIRQHGVRVPNSYTIHTIISIQPQR